MINCRCGSRFVPPARRRGPWRSARLLALCVGTLAWGCAPVRPATESSVASVDWAHYGGDIGGSRYSALSQIDRTNVRALAPAWTYRTGELDDDRYATAEETSLEATPLVIDGTMYLSTPIGRVIALDAATGAERWVFDTRIDRDVRYSDFTSRGVSAWIDPERTVGDPCRLRIFVGTIDARLFAVDGATGRPCEDFGSAGSIDLTIGLANPPREAGEYQVTSPPPVVNGIVVVGSSVADNNRPDAPSGEVRGVDARTGSVRWSWSPVPRDPADPAWESWPGDARRTGGANAWSVLAADPERDLVFVPTSSPSPDYYGGLRPGDNRYANSIVALRASTGEVVWHFQTIHHDLWDYDNAAPPALTTIVRDGERVPAVVQANKTGMLFVLHRETGEPLFPIEEVPVPASDVPGERASPTQPYTVGIEPLVEHDLLDDEIWGPFPEDEEACRAMIAPLRNEGIFTPPSLQGTLVIPSNIGGAHWGGVAIDPERQILVAPANRLASMVQLIPEADYDPAEARSDEARRLGYEYTRMRGTGYVMRRRLLRGPSGLPCSEPPFGILAAVNLETGQRLWMTTHGSMEALVPGVPEYWGSLNLGGPVVTAGGLIFIAGTLDNSIRAHDIETGGVLWRHELPASARATPMTYSVDGRQYVTVAVGGGEAFGAGDWIVTFALPER